VRGSALTRVAASQVLGQLKNVGVVLCSVFLFASVVTGMQAFGYSISIVGFVLYNKAKSGPAAPPIAASKDADDDTPRLPEADAPGGDSAARSASLFARQSASAHVRNASVSDLPGGSDLKSGP
jgi:hypothetical protein